MRIQRARSSVLVGTLLCLLGVVGPAAAAVKTRTVVILPFATVDLSRDEQWLGEAMAQALMLGLDQAPSLIQIDRNCTA